MNKIAFTKMVASGNDFVVIEAGLQATRCKLQVLAKSICDRKYGVGADGLLILEKSKVADIRMRIFNADGSEAQMCGNGARCTALFINTRHKTPACPAGRQDTRHKIETRAGIIDSCVNGDNVSIKLTDPEDIKLDIPIKIGNRYLKINFIDTGVPHAVIFVEGLDKIDVFNLGRQIRYHKTFSPKGTNVDFVEVLSDKFIKIRTYERGVEDETLSCGTGMVAAALITGSRLQATGYNNIKVHTQGRETLEVSFEKDSGNFENVWLRGKVCIAFKGQFLLKRRI
ncbi:MAG: diaminopimelate epimerase [Candidatus Omnitrophica bacterium]|nr:diaminopimelate epimerase [Candidatus Omnitrophota bacterium]